MPKYEQRWPPNTYIVVSRCFRLNVFPNCLPEPHTASRIGKDTKVVLTAIIVTITVRTRSYLLDEDQEEQAEDRGRALPGGGERPGPPGNGGAHGQRVDSRWGTPLPSPGRRPARCRPPLPCRDFTSAGTLLERSEMYHRRPPAAFFPARGGGGGNVCTNPVRARGEESLRTGLEPPTESAGFLRSRRLIPRPGPHPEGREIFSQTFPKSAVLPGTSSAEAAPGGKAGRAMGPASEAPAQGTRPPLVPAAVQDRVGPVPAVRWASW